MKLAAEFAALYHQARARNNPQLMVAALPYARFLGMEAAYEQGGLRFRLPPRQTNIGNPILPALHGGAIAGFMEMSAVIHLLLHFAPGKGAAITPNVPKIIDFSIDYLRVCRFEDTYCECDIVRQGRRVSNLAIKAWQSDPQQPAATARSHYLLE